MIKKEQKYSIGIDLGGTKILAGVVEKTSGKVIFEVKNKTRKEKGGEKIADILIKTVKELFKKSKIKKSEISSIGMAAAGQVNREKGILINSVNLECNDLNLKKIIESEFGLPFFLANDVEGAALGEMKFGAAKGFKDAVCIFVGTGIGSAIIKNGELHLGASGSAGEIGHVIVDLNGRSCTCGGNGCLEAYASRSAIESRILGAIKKGRKSIITDLISKSDSISSKYIKMALDAHDEVVSQYVEEAIEFLSGGVASVMNFYNPEVIIMGGGLIESVDEFYLTTIKKARAKALRLPALATEFKKTTLGDYSAVIGAAILEEAKQQEK